MLDTRDRILDTAERLIADQGYAQTSLRHIIAEAGVNLAAIHYHFGSKEELLDELIQRKAGPINTARLSLLDQFDAEFAPKPAPVERILEAFLAPMVDTAAANPRFILLMGRMHAEGLMPEIILRHFRPGLSRFVAELRRVLPDLPEEELYWRLHFMTGSLAHAACGAPTIPSGPVGGDEIHLKMARLKAFLTGAFQAPPAKTEDMEVTK